MATIGVRVVPVPRHRAALEDLDEQRQAILEQLVVAREVEAEERIRLGERAAAEDHLGAAVRDRVERREALEHAHRIVGAQHGDGGAEPDAAGARRDRREHDLGGGDGEVGAVVLADAEGVEPELVGQHGLLDDVTQHAGLRLQTGDRIEGDVTEGVEPEGERGHFQLSTSNSQNLA